MSDYRRIVSYIYRYENGEKQSNEGFARLEIRNGQLKITIHISPHMNYGNLPQPAQGLALKVYFYRRKGDSIAGICLGEMVLLPGNGDFRAQTDAADIMGSGIGLDATGGMILSCLPNLFFATEWDDHPVTTEDMIGVTGTEEGAETEMDAEEPGKEEEGGRETDRQEPEMEERSEDSGELRKKEPARNWAESSGIWIPADSIGTEEKAEEGTGEGSKEFFQASAAGSMTEESGEAGDPEPDEKAVPEMIQTVSEVLWNEPGRDNASEDWKKGAQSPEALESERKAEAKEGLWEAAAAMQAPEETVSKTQGENRESLVCSADEKPLARAILDQFPKITPFQDGERAECVRGVPQNIGLFPIEAWVLGNNSFLQHGYYNHKHLIFAKKFTRNGIMYLLGVPGYFTARERNMARMFGFHHFKSVKMRPVQNGEFGYWYVPIVF